MVRIARAVACPSESETEDFLDMKFFERRWRPPEIWTGRKGRAEHSARFLDTSPSPICRLDPVTMSRVGVHQ
jgi:hypothetical protein